MSVTATVSAVTEAIAARSKDARRRYLEKIGEAVARSPKRKALGCANVAHGFAACGPHDKDALRNGVGPNIGIVTSYNDMLSAHQPFEIYPEMIRNAARAAGGTAQVAGGVPAMCDGVTQGETGMELSLFSRDVIALSTAIALSHQMFDAAVYLGVCDKIVPGLIIGALSFGHLPAVFIPAGPMTSGLPNTEKGKVRQLFAEGKVGRAALLEAEAQSYHSPGTCTFYGTANSNQMLMEIMGLHLPGSSFVNPGTPLRDAITRESVRQALSITALGNTQLNATFTTPIVFSPDGTKLAVAANFLTANTSEPFVIALDGSSTKRLAVVPANNNQDVDTLVWADNATVFVQGDIVTSNETALFKLDASMTDQTPTLAVGVPTGGDIFNVFAVRP